MKIGVFLQNRNFWGAKIVHAPLLYSLKKQYPKSQITVLCPYKDHEFFVTNHLADMSLQYQKGIKSTYHLLKEKNFDLVINLRPEPIWLNVALFLSRIKMRWGFSHFFAWLSNTKTISYNKKIYRALALANFVEQPVLDAYFKQYSPMHLPEQKNIFILSGGGAGEFKRWGIENFLHVARQIYLNGTKFYFVLGDSELVYLEAIKEFQKEYPCEILVNKSLSELSSYFQSGDLFITNDCGPAHIAQLLKRPLVMILSDEYKMANSVAAEWFLVHEKSRLLVGQPLQDIKSISVDAVVNACRDIL